MVLSCRIELNKEKGILLTVENAEGKITQTAVMDGTSMIFTCKGEEETSTITQTEDKIEIKCKDFAVEATTVTVKSVEDSLYQSDKKLDIKSAEDMTQSSDAKVTASAGGDFDISGAKLIGSASGDVELSGMNVKIDATQKLAMSGMPVEVDSTTKVKLSGLQVEAAATGTLDLKGQATTLEGTATTIKGSIVKIA